MIHLHVLGRIHDEPMQVNLFAVYSGTRIRLPRLLFCPGRHMHMPAVAIDAPVVGRTNDCHKISGKKNAAHYFTSGMV